MQAGREVVKEAALRTKRRAAAAVAAVAYWAVGAAACLRLFVGLAALR